jgi:hypothetical protein
VTRQKDGRAADPGGWHHRPLVIGVIFAITLEFIVERLCEWKNRQVHRRREVSSVRQMTDEQRVVS